MTFRLPGNGPYKRDFDFFEIEQIQKMKGHFVILGLAMIIFANWAEGWSWNWRTTTTTTKSPKTTKAPKTSATTKSNNPKTSATTKSSTSSGGCSGCLPTTTTGPIDSYLGKLQTGSKFTFYGAGGRGACGLDSGTPTMSAAASGQLFKSGGQWVNACRADGQYMLDDPICKGICVKIDYNGKTLTVPINNQCPECDPKHVDLSIPAFNYLEPKGGEVGVATGATITYIKCPSNIPYC